LLHRHSGAQLVEAGQIHRRYLNHRHRRKRVQPFQQLANGRRGDRRLGFPLQQLA